MRILSFNPILMVVWRNPVRPQLFGQFFGAVLFLGLFGCLRPEIIPPVPVSQEPDLPSLTCQSFIEDGYTQKLSYYPGEKMQVFLESRASADICRLTFFDVSGDSVFSVASSVPMVTEIPEDASENGFAFPMAVEFEVPDLQSGVYLIEKKIPFVVKTREPVDVVLVYPSNTANAYATSGGKSLYSQVDRPQWVSFNRPIPLQSLSKACLKWFSELKDFNVGYVVDMDLDDFRSFSNTKVLVIAGHSEYWTRQARYNFDRFVDFGGDALILSGNTMWWQVRYSEEKDKLICHRLAELDPVVDPMLKTINWNEPTLEYSILHSIGAHFPLGGYGLKTDAGWNGYRIVEPSSPLFEGLALEKGQIIALPSLEYDGAPLAGFDDQGYPLIDNTILRFDDVELLAFDKGFRGVETNATFIVFRKKPGSGIIVNTATTDWCSSGGMGGPSGDVIKKITHNALTKLVNDAPVLTP